MKLDLTENETSVLFSVIDAGVKAVGAQAVLPLAPVLMKLHKAAEDAAKEAKHGDDDVQP